MAPADDLRGEPGRVGRVVHHEVDAVEFIQDQPQLPHTSPPEISGRHEQPTGRTRVQLDTVHPYTIGVPTNSLDTTNHLPPY